MINAPCKGRIRPKVPGLGRGLSLAWVSLGSTSQDQRPEPVEPGGGLRIGYKIPRRVLRGLPWSEPTSSYEFDHAVAEIRPVAFHCVGVRVPEFRRVFARSFTYRVYSNSIGTSKCLPRQNRPSTLLTDPSFPGLVRDISLSLSLFLSRKLTCQESLKSSLQNLRNFVRTALRRRRDSQKSILH